MGSRIQNNPENENQRIWRNEESGQLCIWKASIRGIGILGIDNQGVKEPISERDQETRVKNEGKHMNLGITNETMIGSEESPESKAQGIQSLKITNSSNQVINN